MTNVDEDFLGPNPNPYRELIDSGGPKEDEYIASKVFTLPSSGSVFLFGPEIQVVDTPQFQRLAGIKQLGASYVVYRGATHTRFEHSLGTLHMAQKMADAILRNPKRSGGVPISAQAIRLLRLAALLHDLPHIPFGHTLEDEFGLLERHDKNGDRISELLSGEIEQILRPALGDEEYDQLRYSILPSLNPQVQKENEKRKAGGAPELTTDEQIAMLRYPFVSDIVGNTVCADLLDYTARDMHNSGLVGALGDRFLQFLTVTEDARVALTEDEIPPPANRTQRESGRVAVTLDKRGIPRPDVESEILKLLTYRYELAERVYLHHAKNAASAMLARAVQSLGLHKVDTNFLWLSDDLLIQILSDPRIGEVVEVGPRRVGLQLAASGSGNRTVRFDLSRIDKDDFEEARSLGQAVRERQLYKIAYLGVYDDLKDQVEAIAEEYGNPAGRRLLEDLLVDAAGASRGHVVVHCPDAKMMEKVARVRVQSANGVIQTLDDWDKKHTGRVEALNKAHRSLWRIAVYAHPDMPESQVELVAAKMQELLRDVPTRYRRRAKTKSSPWLELVWESKSPELGWPVEARVAAITEVAARSRSGPDMSFDQAVSYIQQVVDDWESETTEEG